MTTTVTRALHDVLAGSVAALGEVADATQDQLNSAAGQQPLMISGDAVAAVLRRYLSGEISSVDAQRWASFVRHGYVAGGTSGPIRPLNFDYDDAHESAIVESIARLDELGDEVDGDLRSGEAVRLLRNLLAPPPALATKPLS